jgi:hypothetical protein
MSMLANMCTIIERKKKKEIRKKRKKEGVGWYIEGASA